MNRSTRTILTAMTTAALAAPMSLAASTANAATLSPQTEQMLQYMVAEEKLAHDVYTVLGATYDVPTFDNIATAEARHQSRVKALLTTYGISDPTLGDAVGEFDDADLQALYDRLVTEGKASITAAANAGITVEKTDIADLDKALATNPPADIARVLQALRSGSERHLAAFTRLKADPTATHTPDGTGARQGQGQGMSKRKGKGQGTATGQRGSHQRGQGHQLGTQSMTG